MKKYKSKMVKFVFTPRSNKGDDWEKPTEPDYHFGNRYTDKINHLKYNKNHICLLFSDELINDPRQFNYESKFTVNEAHILLLKYLEDSLKQARSEKRRVDRMEKYHINRLAFSEGVYAQVVGLNYAKTINNRDVAHNLAAVKKYKKIVKEILASPEYIWEQLLK